MDHRGQEPARPAPPRAAQERHQKKTPHTLIDHFDRLWDQSRDAFGRERAWRRARGLAVAALVGLGRRTVTGLLTATGQQFADWSAAYRLFDRERFDPQRLWAPGRRAVLERLAVGEPLVALLDDTLLRKRGRRIAATGWRRDPLGPRFQTNLVWGQRLLQISAALPERAGACRARGIPIDMQLCQSPRKPRKGAPDETMKAYLDQRRACRLSALAAARIGALRSAIDGDGQRDRSLIVSADGGYTNTTVLRALPERTALVGRLRKDAKLFRPPRIEQRSLRGRPLCYGDPLPTPAALAADESIPWQPLKMSVAGQPWDFQVKRIGPVRWRGAAERDLCVLIIAPRATPPGAASHRVWHEPAYLICSDPELPSERIGQVFLWRWEIEVNFRDEKTLLGAGQAQVRSHCAAERVPTLIGAAYGMMHLAIDQWRNDDPDKITELPEPRWQKHKSTGRVSTRQAQALFRAHLWGRGLGVDNFTDFARTHAARTKSLKFISCPASAAIYAVG